ncbi:MAG TPA: hypothetical protein VHC69_23210 [Polyangiaceae bacterium]|nr:hypothetical protein [Polyangiaceae bacterium]
MRKSSEPALVQRVAIWALATIHLLGILGAPFAAKLHVFQPGATPHQNFHVVWEACKYAAASLLSLAIVLGPLARGERWALWVMTAASLLLFGGVFFSDSLTHGGPAIDFWAYGSFLGVSVVALSTLALRGKMSR